MSIIPPVGNILNPFSTVGNLGLDALRDLLDSDSGEACRSVIDSIQSQAWAGLVKTYNEVARSTNDTGGLNVLSRNLLRDVSNILGSSIANLIEEEMRKDTSAMAYFGVATTMYITAIATIPNVIMIIPYLLVKNLKRYIEIRIEAVKTIKSIILDIDRLLRSIPISANPTGETLYELERALMHLIKCHNYLQVYKHRLKISVETLSGYASPGLFHRAVQELDTTIDLLHSHVNARVFSNIDPGTETFSMDYLGQVGDNIVNEYIKRYGTVYLLLLKIIKRLEYSPNSADPLTLTSPADFVDNHPVLALITSTPIIDTYVKSLKFILEKLYAIQGAQATLSAFLPAMTLPIDGALKIIRRNIQRLTNDVNVGRRRSILNTAALEFGKVEYIVELETAKTLLYGMNPDDRGKSGLDILSETINDLVYLQEIEDYLKNEYKEGSDHPIANLDKEVGRLITYLYKSLIDVTNRKNVTKTISKITSICRQSIYEDEKLLRVLDRFNPVDSPWFASAFATYNTIAAGLRRSGKTPTIFTPLQVNFGKQIGFGIVDSIILSISLMENIVKGATSKGIDPFGGFSALGKVFLTGAETHITSQCADKISPTALQILQSEPIDDTITKTAKVNIETQLSQLVSTPDDSDREATGWMIQELVV